MTQAIVPVEQAIVEQAIVEPKVPVEQAIVDIDIDIDKPLSCDEVSSKGTPGPPAKRSIFEEWIAPTGQSSALTGLI